MCIALDAVCPAQNPNKHPTKALRYIQWFYHDTSDLLLFCINIYSQSINVISNKSKNLQYAQTERNRQWKPYTNRWCCFRLMRLHFTRIWIDQKKRSFLRKNLRIKHCWKQSSKRKYYMTINHKNRRTCLSF